VEVSDAADAVDDSLYALNSPSARFLALKGLCGKIFLGAFTFHGLCVFDA
jgi:hypothetical protein